MLVLGFPIPTQTDGVLRPLAFVGLVAWATLWCGTAHAEVARRVEVSVAGDRETTAALESGLLELSERQGLELDWSTRSAVHPKDVLRVEARDAALLARIWLDVRSSDRAVLYIADTTHDRFLLRVVPLEAGYDEVARESLGNIVESAIDALLAGAEFGVSREALEAQVEQELAATEPAPSPERPAESPRETPSSPLIEPRANESPWLPSGFVGYRVEFAKRTELLRHGPELGVIVWQRVNTLGAFVGVSGGYRMPSVWTGEGVELELQGAGGRLAFGLGSRRQASSWRVGVVAGLEATRVETRVSDSTLSARDPDWQRAPVVGAFASGELRVYRSWGLLLGAGAEYDPMGHHFDVLRGGRTAPVFEPWLLRPVVWVGVSGWRS